MEAYMAAREGKQVAWSNEDGTYRAEWDANTEKLLWATGEWDSGFVTLNRNTQEGWEIVKEKKTLSDKKTPCGTCVNDLRSDEVKEHLKELMDYTESMPMWNMGELEVRRALRVRTKEIFGDDLIDI